MFNWVCSYQAAFLTNEVINREKMIGREDPPVYFESQWQIIAEFSLHGDLGCENMASEKIGEILVSAQIPDRVLVEAKQAVVMVMDKEISSIVGDPAQWTFSIMVQTQLSQSLNAPAHETGSRESNSSSSGWGFFLTEKRISETKSSHAINHIFINIHLYHEGSTS